MQVVVQLKMKIVGHGMDPQALVTKKVIVNGEQRFSG